MNLKHWSPGYISPVDLLDMPFVRHNHELKYLRSLRHLTTRGADFRRMSDFGLPCFRRPYERLYLVYYAPDW